MLTNIKRWDGAYVDPWTRRCPGDDVCRSTRPPASHSRSRTGCRRPGTSAMPTAPRCFSPPRTTTSAIAPSGAQRRGRGALPPRLPRRGRRGHPAHRPRSPGTPARGGICAPASSAMPTPRGARHPLPRRRPVPDGRTASPLQVTSTVATLSGTPGAAAAMLEFAGPIAGATAQRLACDASISRVLLSPSSAVLDVGRTHRLPSGPTRRALRARDGGCAWPNCDRPVSWTSAHHLVHWAQGGPTALDESGAPLPPPPPPRP